MDLIEIYFMERVSTHLHVLEDWQMDPRSWEDEEPPYNKLNIRMCLDSLKEAKTFMKMLNRYQRLKYK